MTSRRRVVLALLLPFVACGIQWLLWDAYIRPYVWFMFFPAAFFSAWLGGFRGGVAGAVIGALLARYFYITPRFSFALDDIATGGSMALFVAMGGLYSWFFERLTLAQRRTDELLAETRVANGRISELYRKTLELDELKSQFFANVSHDLRTPLALIMAPLERWLRTPPAADATGDGRKEVGMMLRNAHLLYRHICDLLDAAKLEAGSMRADYARFDLAELVRAVASNFESLAGERGITYHITVPPILMIEADGEKLQRILLNLLSNAFKFTPADGVIEVCLAADGESAQLEVRDNGPGVPEEMREAVFERFRQVESGGSRHHGGTGLGLAIVREFAALHNGSASAGEAPDGGARFVVRLPLKAPAGTVLQEKSHTLDALLERQAVEELTPSAVQGSAGETGGASEAPLVLVVDDNPDMTDFIARVLRPNFQVAIARDGRAGLEQACALVPDLILCDLMMPEMSGDAMVLELRKRPELAGVPIVILTAKVDDELRVRMLQAGVQDYLAKPFQVEELQARVDSLIRERRRAITVLQASERRFEATFEQAAVGIALVAPDGRWLRVNRKLSTIVGYSPEELLTKTFHDITHPDDLNADVEQMRRMLANEIDTYSMEKRYIRKDGSIIWIDLTVALVRKTGGNPDYFISVVEDISVRKQAEAALREQDQMLRDMSAMAHIGGWAFDPASGQGSWTPECARIHDLPEDAPINVAAGINVYTGEHRQTIEAAVRAACEEGKPYDLELEILTAAGQRKWIRTMGHPLVENGRVVRVFGAFQDITARKYAIEALRESQERLQLLIDHAPASLAMFDRDMRYLAVSQRWRDDYSLGNGAIIGHSHYEILPEIPDSWKAVHQRGLAGEIVVADEDRFVRSDGTVQWLRWEVRPWRAADDSVGGIVIFSEDITRLVAAKDDLRRGSLRLRRLAEVVEHIAAVRDLPALMNVVRPAVRELTGADGVTLVLNDNGYCYYADEDAIGPLWKGQRFPLERCISGWAMINARRAVIEDIYADPRIPHEAYRPTFVKSLAMVPVGRTQPVAAIGAYWATQHKASDEELELQQALADAMSIGLANIDLYQNLERRVNERTAELTAANQELDAFAYAVSHDLRAPLRAMSGFAQALLEDYGSTLQGEAKDYLNEIGIASRKMAELIDGILTLSRSTRGDLQRDAVDLSGLAQRRLDELVQADPARKVAIDVEEQLVAWGDPRMLEVVVTNLIDNAWKYTGKATEAAIHVYRGEVAGVPGCCVRDNGAGFDMAHAERLFKPFQRLHRQDEFPGIGIGLATVQRIVHRHGGEIVASGEPGKGATFCFTLPGLENNIEKRT